MQGNNKLRENWICVDLEMENFLRPSEIDGNGRQELDGSSIRVLLL